MSSRRMRQRNDKPQSENRVPDTSSFLPDVGHFKQNIDRPEDLETEERAIMNMYAKDFDDLKVLNMLTNNNELYQHKLNQYKEVSHTRFQAEKMLQEQRLDRLRYHNAAQNYEEERAMEVEKWMDDEEKNLIANKLKDRLNQPKTPDYVPTTAPKPRIPTRPTRLEEDYDPEVGFGFHIDYISNISKGVCNQIKAAYAVFTAGEMVIGNKHMGPVLVTPDTYSVTHEKAQFSMKHNLKLIEAEKNTNLIVEVQIPDRKDPNRFKALGWSLMNLFTFEKGKLNVGIFKLPIYDIPTNPNLSVNDIKTLTPINGFI